MPSRATSLVSAFAIAALLSSAPSAFAETGYLYDNSGKTAKTVNDIPVWKDAAAAQTKSRHPTAKNIRSMKCLAKPRVGATLYEKTGSAREVKVHGNCRGFVNSAYVHAEK